jgi:glucosamine 6-phosphate synthetase-like amidotransferase/phosphosugar isomerase protein
MNIIRLALDCLISAAQSRGRVSTGIAFINPQEVAVMKEKIVGEEFVKLGEYKEVCQRMMVSPEAIKGPKRLISIIGHCRAPTKGSASIRQNNHPIITDHIVGVHNGHISNDEDLFAEFGHFAKNWKRAGQVDSEIIFRLLDYYMYEKSDDTKVAIRKACQNLRGGYACAFMSSRYKYAVWLFRNHNPIEMMLFPEVGFVVFASSMQFIQDATKGLALGRQKRIVVPQDTGIGLDLYKNKKIPFELDKVTRISGFVG